MDVQPQPVAQAVGERLAHAGLRQQDLRALASTSHIRTPGRMAPMPAAWAASTFSYIRRKRGGILRMNTTRVKSLR